MDKPIVDQFPRRVREVENVWIPLRDGARLAARLWLPEDAEADPVPAIVEYMPYRKRDLLRLRDQPMHHYFAGHGYAALRVDLRGAGDSDGVLGPHRRRWKKAMKFCARYSLSTAVSVPMMPKSSAI